MRRHVVIFLTVAAVTMCICGCKASDTQIQETQNTTEGSSKAEEALSIHFHSDNRYTILDKDGNILPVFQLAGEKTNIKVENVANPISQNSIEEFQLQATEKFPADIYGGVNIKNSILGYAQQGAFIPLNELIDLHAPNIKKFLEEHPEEKAAMSAPDGNIYMINYMPDGTTGKAYFIRKDWLDTLGLEIPKTFDELEKTLYAFRDEDPNGNGKKDEIPYFNERWQEAIRLVNLWGARAYSSENFNERIPVNADGQLYHAWMTDEFRDGIVNLNRWYEDGILDSEMFTRKTDTVRQTLWSKDNVGGMTHEWVASTSVYNYDEELLKQIPKFKVEGMLPVSATGTPFEEFQRSAVKPDGWAISVNCEKPEVAIRYMDWFFSEEGYRAANFGIEVESYTMVEGKPQFTEEILNSGAVNINLRTTYGAQLSIGCKQNYDYERQWTMKEGVDAYDLYNQADIWSEAWTPMLNYTEEEMAVYNRIISSLNDYQNEKIAAFVTGKEDVQTEWNTYMEQCRKLGADELVAVYQQAYNRYLEQRADK